MAIPTDPKFISQLILILFKQEKRGSRKITNEEENHVR